jgi:hypothetical protein
MATTTTYNPNRTIQQSDPCRPCPVCHGLECLCRPRFFAGQLLTEEDLNRLEQYVVNKSRLHNRYLHGWGVACGLEVVCDPCGNQVIVKPGYALSPCGDDIVVCQDAGVDLCALINACCQPPLPDCDPPRTRPKGCDGESQWILSICYDEYTSRKLPSLTATCNCGASSKGSCGCGKSIGGCNCGGKGTKSGGCGCQSAGASSRSTSATAPKTAGPRSPVACQPSLICESYRFCATPVPTAPETSRGAMVDRFLNCVKHFSDAVPQPPANPTTGQLSTWCRQVREALLNAMTASSVTECSVFDSVQQLCPDPAPNTTPAQYLATIATELLALLVRQLQACLCSSLLPPCPEPALDNCVPIGTITVTDAGAKCKIVRICNLEHRKFVTTFPNLQYWLSWLPFARQLRQALERLCCRPTRIPQPGKLASAQPLRLQSVANPRPGNFARVLLSTLAKHTSDAPTGLAAMGFDLLGLRSGNAPFLDATEAAEPVMTLLLQELAAPLIAAELPPGLGKLAKAAGAAQTALSLKQDRARAHEITDLKASLAKMEEQMKSQYVMIAGLTALIKK